jgi:hypothetical protein
VTVAVDPGPARGSGGHAALTVRTGSCHTRSMDRNSYAFHSEWSVDAPPDTTYLALERFDHYPEWWPEVRSIRLLEAETCLVTCRSLLPYTLTFVLRPSRRDPGSGVLEASMVGDLEGFSRWTITPEPDGSRLVFDEEVTVNKRLLRLLAPLARPLFRANHTVMMKHGQAGLAAYLNRSAPLDRPDRPRPSSAARGWR